MKTPTPNRCMTLPQTPLAFAAARAATPPPPAYAGTTKEVHATGYSLHSEDGVTSDTIPCPPPEGCNEVQ